MNHAGLFSGIGGFSYAAQMMGWANVFDVEIDDWCRKVLHKNFPTTQLFSDVCTFDGLPFRGTIDILSGGFPCQPFSTAGKGLGNADPRALWPQMLRIIQQVQPRYVVGENVRGLLSSGGGLAFEAVCADLEAAGYDVQPFLLPACGVGAIHKRDRFWFVAHAKREFGDGRENVQCSNQPDRQKAERVKNADNVGGLCEAGHQAAELLAHAHNERREERQPAGEPAQPGRAGGFNTAGATAAHAGSTVCQRPAGQWLPADGEGRAATAGGAWRLTEPPVCPRNDGIPGQLVRPDRARILKAAGNAIVPQVALQIFRALALADQSHESHPLPC